MAYVNNLIATTSTSTTGFVSPDLDVHIYHALQIDLVLTTLTAGTSPGITASLKRKDANGNYNLVYTTTATLTNTTTNSVQVLSIGQGYTLGYAIGQTAQVSVVVSGAPTGIGYSLSVNADS